MTSSYILLTGLIAATYFHYGDCVKCYTCNSLSNEKCADPMLPDASAGLQCTPDLLRKTAEVFNIGLSNIDTALKTFGISNQLLPKAVDANIQCAKVKVITGDQKEVIHRQCALAPGQNFDPCAQIKEGMEKAQAGLKVTYCETCPSDYCNSGNSLKITAVLLLPLLAILISNFN